MFDSFISDGRIDFDGVFIIILVFWLPNCDVMVMAVYGTRAYEAGIYAHILRGLVQVFPNGQHMDYNDSLKWPNT